MGETVRPFFQLKKRMPSSQAKVPKCPAVDCRHIACNKSYLAPTTCPSPIAIDKASSAWVELAYAVQEKETYSLLTHSHSFLRPRSSSSFVCSTVANRFTRFNRSFSCRELPGR